MKVICKDFEVRGEIIADNCTFNVAVILDPNGSLQIKRKPTVCFYIRYRCEWSQKTYAFKTSEVVRLLTRERGWK